jgi:hypothetical protein
MARRGARAFLEEWALHRILILAALLALPAAALAERPSDARRVQMPPGMGASPQAVDAAARPGDAEMTCEQIGAELAPYAMQMRQSFEASGMGQDAADAQALMDRQRAQAAQQAAPSMAATIVGSVLPGAGAAAMAAQIAQQQRAAAEAAPIRERMMRNSAAFQADMSTTMRDNPRMQRLMQLAEERNCH